MISDKFNLFVYGSLRDRVIFQSVSGYSFSLSPVRRSRRVLKAELALLPGHRRVSPDNVYYYAVADSASRIEGYVVYDVPKKAMDEIDRYEGKRYRRQTVSVNTAGGIVNAEAYLVSSKVMKKHFGDRFHVNLIHELWLRKRIGAFIRKHTRTGDKTLDAEIERQAERQLLGTTERDLVMSHYHSDVFSDYFIEHELDRPRPSIKKLYDNPEAAQFIENYLDLAVKQVLLNQLESIIYSHYRFELNHLRTSDRYYHHSISLIAAMRVINTNEKSVKMILNERRRKMPYHKHDLIDYIKYGVRAGRNLFDRRVINSDLERIRSNLQPGLTPLGAEVELSNVGFAAVEPYRSQLNIIDAPYDGFRYFHEFELDVLMWKLGGYVDDHTGLAEEAGRRGYLELAPGRLSIAGELSRPATADPFILNQLIREITLFYDVNPHSLHLSLQLRRNQIGRQKPLLYGFAQCLLALGGGLQVSESGKLWISRVGHAEITPNLHGEEFVLARCGKRGWYMGQEDILEKAPKQSTSYVQQYKFIRLEKSVNYEPLILCLKGLQLAYNPGDYLTVIQLKNSPLLKRQYETLKQWALSPTEIDSQTINDFIETVHRGLMNEGHHKPAHKLHYIHWAMDEISNQLKTFNERVRSDGTKPQNTSNG